MPHILIVSGTKFRNKYPSTARHCGPRELGVGSLASPPRYFQNGVRSFKRPPPHPEKCDGTHRKKDH